MAVRNSKPIPQIVPVFSCEHGGNSIPSEFRRLFASAREILQSHRGWDPGALELAKRFARHFDVPLTAEVRSRLLIEMNRSLHHPRLFSEYSRALPESIRQKLIDDVYHPYRDDVTRRITALSKKTPVVHLSVHSFTPVMNGTKRRTDIGLLFDPQRPLEAAFCRAWKRTLKQVLPGCAVHMNLPYRGTSDGFTAALRTEFPEDRYAGIELEVNQKFPLGDAPEWKRIQQILVTTFDDSLRGFRLDTTDVHI